MCGSTQKEQTLLNRSLPTNANFDRKMLEQSAKLAGIIWPAHLSWWCLMNAFAHWYGQELPFSKNYRWQKLALACQEFNIDESAFVEEHRALGDAQRAYAVLEALAIRAPEAVGTPFVAALEALRAAHRAREVTQKPSAPSFWRAFLHLFSSQGGR